MQRALARGWAAPRPWGQTSIAPATIVPLLALGFGGLAGWLCARTRQWRGAVATWLLLALWFAGVALWLHLPLA